MQNPHFQALGASGVHSDLTVTADGKLSTNIHIALTCIIFLVYASQDYIIEFRDWLFICWLISVWCLLFAAILPLLTFVVLPFNRYEVAAVFISIPLCIAWMSWPVLNFSLLLFSSWILIKDPQKIPIQIDLERWIKTSCPIFSSCLHLISLFPPDNKYNFESFQKECQEGTFTPLFSPRWIS